MRILAIILSLLSCFSLFGQAAYKDLKPAMIVRLTEQITWPNEPDFNKFNLGIYGLDTPTYNILNVPNIKVREKAFNVQWVSDIQNLAGIDILFVDQTKVDELETISRLVEKKSILLISERSRDLKSIMINLQYNEQQQSISFQVNKANLIIEGFAINPELLLLGGTEVDLRQLVREMKRNVDQMSEQVTSQQSIISTSKLEINQLRGEIDNKTSENQKLAKSNADLNQQIELNVMQLRKVSDSIQLQRKALQLQSETLGDQSKQLQEQTDQLAKQNDLIVERSRILDSIAFESMRQSATIQDQSQTIVSKEDQIDQQARLIYVFVAFSVIVLVLAFIAFRFYRKKVSFSTQLSAKNEELLKEQKTVKSALNELEKTQVQLVQSEKMAALGVLTAGVAHEINNPTGFIKSGLEVLKQESSKDSLDPKNLGQLISHMELGVSRITAIVKSLNAFSRTGEKGMTQCKIHQILEDCLTILYHQYKDRITINKQYSPEDIETVGNESQLYQVFTNLFSNSIQAITDEGTIEIETRSNGQWNHITVADSGCGISKKDLNKIFDPFFTTKDPGVGTGLGLSIVYKIIEDHEGKIAFDSTPGVGTKVQLSLKTVG